MIQLVRVFVLVPFSPVCQDVGSSRWKGTMAGFELPHLVAILIAALAGGSLVWLVLGPSLRRTEAARAAAAGEGERLRGETAELGRRCASAEARADRVPALDHRIEELGRALMDEARRADTAEARLASAVTEHEARLHELRRMGEEMDRKFGALAQKALSGNAESFLKLVSERFEKHAETAGADLGKRQQAIEGMLKPIADNLQRFESRVGEIEKARENAYGAIREHVRQLADGQSALRGETARLVQALRQPKTRGSWGEFQLRQVFEMAGMVEHVDFLAEHSLANGDGRLRPDAIVRMPGGKSIVVDAKTPFDGFLAMVEAEDDGTRADALKAHVRHVRQHIASLGRKEYWSALDVTPDFVVMFIPNEGMYSCAIATEPGIFEEAMRNRVLISTPTTLIGLLKAIAYGWQQEKLARNAQEVATLARELYTRISTFGANFADVGKSLRQAVERYNKSVGSLEGRVLPQARKFERLGVVGAGAELPQLTQVELEPRELTAAEFAGASELPSPRPGLARVSG
jgi:DNA recombination protein RmuC